MKFLVYLVILTLSGSLFAADAPKMSTDPFAGAFFPPDLVLVARDLIGMSQAQQEAFLAQVEKTQPRSNELRTKLERETAALSALLKHERVDEAAISAQLDKVLDIERELKQLHTGLLVAIKNLLTPEQQAQLRKFIEEGDPRFTEAVRKRLSERVERVMAGVQKWLASGRDPSEIAKTMKERIKPLIDAGKVVEADAELERLLDQLKEDAK